jgi:hypothetical protein
MSVQLTDPVVGELQPGERLLWHGSPDAGRLLQAQDLYLIPFSLMWGGFAIFWEVMAITSTRDLAFFPLFGVPFVAIGLYMICGRFAHRRWLRAHTAYGLTERRAFAITPALLGGPRVRSVWLASYPATERHTRRGGRGTIVIGDLPIGPRWMLSDASWPGMGRYMGGAIVFTDIEESDRVYALLAAAIGGPGASRNRSEPGATWRSASLDDPFRALASGRGVEPSWAEPRSPRRPAPRRGWRHAWLLAVAVLAGLIASVAASRLETATKTGSGHPPSGLLSP